MMGISMPRRRVAGIVNLERDWFFSHSALHDHHSELELYRDVSLAILFALTVYSPPHPSPTFAAVRRAASNTGLE